MRRNAFPKQDFTVSVSPDHGLVDDHHLGRIGLVPNRRHKPGPNRWSSSRWRWISSGPRPASLSSGQPGDAAARDALDAPESGLLDDLAAAAGHSGRTWREAERVLALFIESFVLWQKFGLSIGIASGLTGFAALAQTKGQFVRAARLWGAAAAVRASAEACLAPLARAEYDRFTAALRAQLGDAAFASAWVEGRALTAEKAVAYALAATSGRVLPSSDPEAPQETRPGPLSAREREVLRLIADGLSNREIAHHLVMAVGTIKWYTGQIYSKLGARGRTQAIALARASGLLP